MKILTFKTNINCDGCIAKVKETLDNLAGKENWEVDISYPNKILTIKSETVTDEEIEKSLEKVGYKATVLVN